MFTSRGLRGLCGRSGRHFTLGIALSAWLFTAGCIGWIDSPNGGSQSSQLSPSSAQVRFGNVTVGSPTSQLVSLTAAGNSNVTISSVSVSGTGFAVSGGTNVTLTPSQSVTLSVSFQPQAAGAVSGELLVSSNASNSSLQIGLSGAGVAASGNRSVALNWQASSSPVIGYFVYRGPSASNLSQLNGTAVASTSYTDRNVVNGQTYVYAVRSVDASNALSNFSNTVKVTIPAQ